VIEIQWTDTDPETDQRRIFEAERFANQWRFFVRFHRRGERTEVEQPTRSMWEAVLDALQRRYQRREKVSAEVVREVERIIRDWREPPQIE
jgi:hypothetical protein